MSCPSLDSSSACPSEFLSTNQRHTGLPGAKDILSPNSSQTSLAMNYSGNLVLAAAMLVSSIVLLLSLSRKRVPPPPAHGISQRHQVKAPRSCLLPSEGRKGERKKKRVKFADDLKEDCSVRSSTEESKKLQRSCKIEEQGMVGMQSNGVASRIECSC